MRERQRWRAEEDAVLRAYVREYGPREWHLVAQRMGAPQLRRDAKSCLERWKNYLRPGIKKGSLTEEEQRLVVRLQAKHGNKWKRIAAEVPGRTAKRLGKWWEVFKEKQQRESSAASGTGGSSIETSKYDSILEGFAEKLVSERRIALAPPPPILPPPWPSAGGNSPCVDLRLGLLAGGVGGTMVTGEVWEWCREVAEGQRAWAAQRKEAAWRLTRVELQLEAERAAKRKSKAEEIEARIRQLREEERAALEAMEAEFSDRIAELRRDAEAKEQKLAEQWAATHARLSNVMEQLGCAGCRRWVPAATNVNGQ